MSATMWDATKSKIFPRPFGRSSFVPVFFPPLFCRPSTPRSRMLARTSLHNHTHQPTTAVTYEGWDAIMVLTQSVSGMGTIFIFIFLLVTGASIVVNLLVAVIMIKFQEAKEMEDEHGLEEDKEKERQQILLKNFRSCRGFGNLLREFVYSALWYRCDLLRICN